MTLKSNCPVCGHALHEELVMNALSRRDNATYICSDCGVAEALQDFDLARRVRNEQR